MLLAIQTQVYENYGHPYAPYWKPKGGQCHKITDIPLGLTGDALNDLSMVVESANDWYTECVIGWSIEADDYLSEFEKSQLEYEGDIQYREPILPYSEAVNLILEEEIV